MTKKLVGARFVQPLALGSASIAHWRADDKRSMVKGISVAEEGHVVHVLYEHKGAPHVVEVSRQHVILDYELVPERKGKSKAAGSIG